MIITPLRVRSRVAVALAAWSVAYACYRAYYALGGRFAIIGTPVSYERWRTINAVGAAIIAAAAVLAFVTPRSTAGRRALPVLGWLGAVGCCMHAVTDEILRILSVTGVHPTELPATVWRSFDRSAADLQDLLLNEPWFFVEGLLWGALGIGYVRASRRRAWLASAVAAVIALSAVGVLTGLGKVSSFHLA